MTGFKSSLLQAKKICRCAEFQYAEGAKSEIGGFVGIGVLAEPDEKTDEYDFAAVEKMIGQDVVRYYGFGQAMAAGKSGERS